MTEDYESKSWDEILSQTCPTADEIKQITPVSGHDRVVEKGEWQRCHSPFSHLYRRSGTRRAPDSRSDETTAFHSNWIPFEEFATFLPGNLWPAVVHYNHRKEKARTAKICPRRRCRFNSCRGLHIAPWCRWLTCLPVTQEIAGSSPVGVAI